MNDREWLETPEAEARHEHPGHDVQCAVCSLVSPYEPPARDTVRVRRSCVPMVWWIYPDGWDGAWQAFGTRAHAERKARKVLTRLNCGRESFTVKL